MRIVVASVGARGDVLPMVALSKELQGRGHHVIVCAPEMYRSLLMKLELFMVSSGVGYQQLLEGFGEGDRGTELVLALSRDVATQFVALRDALREAEVLIGSMLVVAAPSMAEQRKIPYFYVVSNPILLNRSPHPCLGIPQHETEGLLGSRRRKHRLQQWEDVLGSALNRERENSHLHPVSDMYQHLFGSGHRIAAHNPEFLPDASSDVVASGFLYYEDPEVLDAETEKYLNEGPPPVYVGPVSEKISNPISILRRLCESVLAAGSRVVISSVWKDVQQSVLPAGCKVLESTAFSHLLPRMAAVVHGGTTEFVTVSTRAGIPQVVVPYLMDQTFWAERVHALGLGPAPLSEFSLKQVTEGVHQALSAPIRDRARAMGERIRAANGIAAAADIIDKQLGL